MRIDHNLDDTHFQHSAEWEKIVEFCENNDFTDVLMVRILGYEDEILFKWQERDGFKRIIRHRAPRLHSARRLPPE